MSRYLLLAACLAVLGCAKPPKKVEKPTDYTTFLDSSCYTVDLFDRHDIIPASAEVPVAFRGYLGDWGNGAWDGQWCHDLRVLSVSPSGEVDLLDMHAPRYTNSPATVFRRKAIIDGDGNLRFAYDKETHIYRLDGRFLVGKRIGDQGELEIAMTRKDVVPLPVARPERLALGN
ncbi:MAG: hypothetical protein AAFR17_00940 [Pseudomonadota bacterium]